jgi:hypothetical protein
MTRRPDEPLLGMSGKGRTGLMLSPDRNTGERDDVLFSFIEYTIRNASLFSDIEVEKQPFL